MVTVVVTSATTFPEADNAPDAPSNGEFLRESANLPPTTPPAAVPNALVTVAWATPSFNGFPVSVLFTICVAAPPTAATAEEVKITAPAVSAPDKAIAPAPYAAKPQVAPTAAPEVRRFSS